MLNYGAKIYLCTGVTDMRKGMNGLSLLTQTKLAQKASSGAMFVFRGRSADRIKILWWDGQAFCLYYKCLNRGKFTWPRADCGSLSITAAQLSMLIEGIDWRSPVWSDPSKCAG